MDKIIQTQQLIGEINRMHREFSNAYFETGRMEKSIFRAPLGMCLLRTSINIA